MYILFATAVYRPGHGSLSPLALGLTIYVATVAGEASSHISQSTDTDHPDQETLLRSQKTAFQASDTCAYQKDLLTSDVLT